MPYVNLATAGEGTHNSDAVRTAKKNESCGEATPWGRINPSPHLAPSRAGLSFCPRPRSHGRMDPDLENVIRQALGDAQAAGRDHLSQNELAVQAVQRARPDMTASDALAAVNLVRRE